MADAPAAAMLYRQQLTVAELAAVALAVPLLLAEPLRFSAPSWATLWEFGGPRPLGAVLLALAVVLAWATRTVRPRPARWALLGLAATHCWVAVLIATPAVLGDSRAGYTGSVAFGALTLWHMVLAAALRGPARPAAGP